MVTELARAMACPPEDALERLLELGPYDLKSLLHHILSRKEFRIDKGECGGMVYVGVAYCGDGVLTEVSSSAKPVLVNMPTTSLVFLL